MEFKETLARLGIDDSRAIGFFNMVSSWKNSTWEDSKEEIEEYVGRELDEIESNGLHLLWNVMHFVFNSEEKDERN